MGVPMYVCYGLITPTPHTLPHALGAAVAVNGAFAGLFVGSVFKYFSATTRAFVQGAAVALGVGLGAAVLGEKTTRQAAGGALLVLFSIGVFAKGRTQHTTVSLEEP